MSEPCGSRAIGRTASSYARHRAHPMPIISLQWWTGPGRGLRKPHLQSVPQATSPLHLHRPGDRRGSCTPTRCQRDRAGTKDDACHTAGKTRRDKHRAATKVSPPDPGSAHGSFGVAGRLLDLLRISPRGAGAQLHRAILLRHGNRRNDHRSHAVLADIKLSSDLRGKVHDTAADVGSAVLDLDRAELPFRRLVTFALVPNGRSCWRQR